MRSPLGAVLDRVARPRNLSKPPAPYSGRPGLASAFARGADGTNEIRAYGENGTLFAVVSLYAQAVSSVQWHLYRQTTTDARLEDRPEVTSHLALDLWNRPNDFMTGQQFRETVQQHLDLCGEGWIVVERSPVARSVPLGLWPVRPDRMVPIPSREKFLAGYMYVAPDGEQIPLQIDQVIQLKYPNPADPYRGLGPVQALLSTLDAARYSVEWNRNFFINGAIHGGLITVDHRLSDDEFDEMSRRWQEQHRGYGNAHRVAIIEQGTWQDQTYTMRDMQFAELLNVSRDMIREAFRMHSHMLGQTEDVNLANAQAADYTFARWGVETRAARWQDMLNFQYLRLFGTTGEGLEFDHDTVVPVDQEADNATLTAKANAAAVLVDAGYEPAEVLGAVGLPPIAFTGPPAAPVQPEEPDAPGQLSGRATGRVLAAASQVDRDHHKGPDYTAADLGVDALRSEEVDPQVVNVDRQHYQRPLDPDRVKQFRQLKRKKLAARWGLLAKRPDGSYWAVNGQHHTQAALDEQIPTLNYRCFDSVDWVQEAQVYAAFGRWHDNYHDQNGGDAGA